MVSDGPRSNRDGEIGKAEDAFDASSIVYALGGVYGRAWSAPTP